MTRKGALLRPTRGQHLNPKAVWTSKKRKRPKKAKTKTGREQEKRSADGKKRKKSKKGAKEEVLACS